MSPAAPSTTDFLTEPVRLSYVHVWEPFSQSGKPEDAKYSCQLLIPKSDKVTLARFDAAAEAAKVNGAHKFGGKVPKNLPTTMHDCDEEDDLDEKPENAGCYRVTVTTNTAPGIVDKAVQPILDQTQVYSGCWAKVALNASAYNTNGNKGITFYLRHIQKFSDDENLAGRSKPEDVFSPIEEDSEESLI